MANVTGWGRAGWGTDGWGTPDDLDVTGVAGTSALGSVTVLPVCNVSVTSNRGVGSVGSVVVGISVTFEVTGVSATGEIGTTNVWGLINTSQTNSNWQEIAA